MAAKYVRGNEIWRLLVSDVGFVLCAGLAVQTETCVSQPSHRHLNASLVSPVFGAGGSGEADLAGSRGYMLSGEDAGARERAVVTLGKYEGGPAEKKGELM
jgi:hypothetical protein